MTSILLTTLIVAATAAAASAAPRVVWVVRAGSSGRQPPLGAGQGVANDPAPPSGVGSGPA